MVDYIISVDLGQSRDYSTFTVLHRVWWRKGQRPFPENARLWHQVPTIHRWELGTPYPQIVEELAQEYNEVTTWSDNGDKGVRMVVDAGGPGRPVIDLLKEKRLRPIGVTITGGEITHEREDGTLTVPKRDIVSALVVAAQAGDVKVAREWAEEFDKELNAFGYEVNLKTGRTSYESQENNIHDDMVVAAALGLWYSTTRLPKVLVEKRANVSDEYARYNPIRN